MSLARLDTNTMVDSGNTGETSKLVANKEQSRKNWYLGYVFGFVNAVMFPASLGTAQALGNVVPALQLQAFRCAAMGLVAAVFTWIWKLDLYILLKKDTTLFAVVYALLDLGDHFTVFYSVKYISVTTSVCLQQGLEVFFSFGITLMITRMCKVSHSVSFVPVCSWCHITHTARVHL